MNNYLNPPPLKIVASIAEHPFSTRYRHYLRLLLLSFTMLHLSTPLFSQRGYNYYKDSGRVGSPNSQAYSYFKKAYYDHIWNWTKEGADSAEHYLKLAIQEDTAYAAAYGFLAHVYQFKTYINTDRDKYFALEKKYAQKAVSLNPATGDAYSAMADVLWEEKDTIGAINILRKAIAREPDNAGNYIWLAIRYRQAGQKNHIDSSIMLLHQLMELDPEYGQAYMKLGYVYQWNRPDMDSARHYYRKAIEVYNTVKPRDNRMMEGYYRLGDIYKNEKKYDSAAYHFNNYLQQLEPSNMYIKEMGLSMVNQGLYDCYLALAAEHLHQFIQINNQRIANNPNDAKLLLSILEGEAGGLMAVRQDSVAAQYTLPLARKLQKMSVSDPYIRIFAIWDEYDLLKRLRRDEEAMKVLQMAHTKQPNEPLLLFELGRAYIVKNKPSEGLAYLQKSKQNLNDVIKPAHFTLWLSDPEFDKVRHLPAFKALIE